jgi:hypothetical protein
MTHPLRGSTEDEKSFLFRLENIQIMDGHVLVEAGDLAKLIALARHWRRLETEAAKYVESVICMHSAHFTGEPPYVGWEGLGRALQEDYADLRALRDPVV